MCDAEIVSEFVNRKVSLATTPLSADGGHSLKVPSVQGLVDAAEAEHLILPALRVLINIFTHVMEKSE